MLPSMCRRVTCQRCEKASWAGCGQHVSQVMAGVPKKERCSCTPEQMAAWKKEHSFFHRLFGKKAPA